MTSLFSRRAVPGRAGQVKAWVTEHLGLTEADLVTVAELACHEPGCPPVETVVTLHGTGGARRSWRMHKALAEVERTDIVVTLQREPDS
jgi:hypothetical protein